MNEHYVIFNGVKYAVNYYGLDNCSGYTDLNGEDVQYTAPMLHLGDGFRAEAGGEMDLPFDMTWGEAIAIANHTAESCGYMANGSEEKRTVNVFGQYQAYRVTYGELGGIVNVENITLETRIKGLESQNEGYQNRINNIESGFMTEKNYGGTPIQMYRDIITENNKEIAKLKEQQNAV